MNNFGVVTREFAVNYEAAFAYLSDLKTLPEWTELFSDANDTSSLLQFPDGSTHRINIEIQSSLEFGVVDWLMTMPDGSVAPARSRLTKLDDAKLIYSFMFLVPPLPSDGERAEFLENQLGLINREFDLLGKVFASRPEFQSS